jgi:hypothetical protein
MRVSLWLAVVLACPMMVACAVTVPAPDFAFLQDTPATDPGGTDLGTDPGTPDDTLTDPGEDPGTDPGEDPGTEVIVIPPQNGGYPCALDAECVSGSCSTAGFCTCRDVDDCDSGQWCDVGTTIFNGTLNCLPWREDFAGCTTHAQCRSGACDGLNTGSGGVGYCAQCANGGTQCDSGTLYTCCGGRCVQGCMGCAIAPPPAPELQFCASGCWDPATQFCGPEGPTYKLGATADCQHLHSWCLTNSCLESSDGKNSVCSCDDGIAPCQQGFCFEGRCEIAR